jgi:NAD(P)-dependent dehydrogenase (short-subunit alcohol dehydrogenase family)
MLGGMAKTALVTGSNRGLGLETVKQLAAAGFHVIGTSREESSGRKVIEGLGKGRDVVWEPLDVSDQASIVALAKKLEKDSVELDVLVNNAGTSMKGFDAHVAERTNAVNFFGTMHVTDALVSRIRDKGRIVNVSSGMGELGSNYSDEIKKRFLDPELDREKLVALVNEFIRDVAALVHADRGWPSSAYRVSKAAMNAFTRIVAKELASRGILANAVCPGWVKTDMGGPSAMRDVETGGRSIVWGALIPDDGPTGGFFRDGKAIPW